MVHRKKRSKIPKSVFFCPYLEVARELALVAHRLTSTAGLTSGLTSGLTLGSLWAQPVVSPVVSQLNTTC